MPGLFLNWQTLNTFQCCFIWFRNLEIKSPSSSKNDPVDTVLTIAKPVAAERLQAHVKRLYDFFEDYMTWRRDIGDSSLIIAELLFKLKYDYCMPTPLHHRRLANDWQLEYYMMPNGKNKCSTMPFCTWSMSQKSSTLLSEGVPIRSWSISPRFFISKMRWLSLCC